MDLQVTEMACSGCVNRLSFCCLSAQSILLVSCAFWLGSHAAPVQHRGHWPEAADLATLAAPNCSLLTLWSAEQLQITARPLLPPNSIVSHAYLNCLAFDRRGFAKEVVFTVVDNDNALRQLHFVCTHNGSLEMDLFGFPNPTNTGETCRGCRNATESCDGKALQKEFHPVKVSPLKFVPFISPNDRFTDEDHCNLARD